MKITYHGHSCFVVEGSKGSVIIDPFLDGNPHTKLKPEDIKVNGVLVTHAHFDHMGSAIEIAKACNALVVSCFEIVGYCQSQGAEGHPLHIGGGRKFDFAEVKLTQAFHGSTTNEGQTLGTAAGLLVKMDEKTLYHAGDTGIFGDMKLIGEMNDIDVAILPIGGNFTMDIKDALKATEMLNPKVVVPMHYNTFPPIEADPDEFASKVKEPTKGVVIEFGDNYEV